jgi:RES domain-containing protein
VTPLPGALGSGEIIGWRLDIEAFVSTWNSGLGAHKVGGRWNSRGRHVVYAALDPSTAIVEVAVHKGFRVLDTQKHFLTAFGVPDPSRVHVVHPDDIPNPHWLHPCVPGQNQQEFGDQLLARHDFVAIPSAVSARSWNLIFDPTKAGINTLYHQVLQERFALDPRLAQSNVPAA